MDTTTVNQFSRLEALYDQADGIDDKPLTLTATLTELCRVAQRPVTESQAEYWADRLESLLADIETDCPECARSYGPHYSGPCEH